MFINNNCQLKWHIILMSPFTTCIRDISSPSNCRSDHINDLHYEHDRIVNDSTLSESLSNARPEQLN